MNECDVIRELLVLHAEGAVGPDESCRIEKHLAACPGCREEQAQILRIRSWLEDPELFEPNQDMAWQLLPEKLASRASSGPIGGGRRAWLGPMQWIGGIAACLAIALILIWPALRGERGARPVQPVPSGNEAFLSRMRTAYAREATSQYLGGCHALLLDLASAEGKCDAGGFDVSFEVARARQLLQQKRMLDAEPAVPATEHARGLCDDLERFLLDLSTAEKCETADSLRSLERFIQSEQLLLRIKVIQAGIS